MMNLNEALQAQIAAARHRDLSALLRALAGAREAEPPEPADAEDLLRLHGEVMELVSAWRGDQLRQAATYKAQQMAPRFLSTTR